MRWSRFYIYTAREAPSDAEVVSHRLMVRASMIRKLAAGIYTYLPLGWRSIRKMSAIVRRELDAAGAVELSMPAVQPAELWQESGRWGKYGDLLLRMHDRNEREFCFGPTHEEVITDTVRRDVRSYRQLPLNLYQIQTKFRDEIRPRFGLMRGREFLMKDAYSFHTDAASLDETYEEMRLAYRRIFEACGLDYELVEADTGDIGGSSSHEFMVVADTGEDAVVRCPACSYAANVEKAETRPLPAPRDEDGQDGEPAAMEEVATPGQSAVSEVADFLGVSPQHVVKTLIYETVDGNEDGLVAVAIRGDREVNEVKLANALGVQHLSLAGEDKVRDATGSPPGFAGPVGLGDAVPLLVDRSAADLASFVCGANAADAHLRNAVWGRDVNADRVEDVLLVEAGDACPRCDGTLELYRGIETGHIFKLGTKYSETMKCNFTDENGDEHPMIMGCYGLGIGRTVAAAVEQNHDKEGIVWPRPLAPFEVLLVGLNTDDRDVQEAAERLHGELREKGADLLYDDRDERPGVKFKDADLIGFPVRLVVGARSLAEGKVEISLRRDREKQLVPVGEAAAKVMELLAQA